LLQIVARLKVNYHKSDSGSTGEAEKK
jgi:hypothetical protein